MRLILAILILISTNSVHAELVKAKGAGKVLTKNLSIDEMINEADIIFKGSLESSKYTELNGLQVRQLRYRVIDPIRGSSKGLLTLNEWAGTGSPTTNQIIKGKPYVFFYHEPSDRGLTSLIGMDQGVVGIDRENRLKYSQRLKLKPKKRNLLQMITGDQPELDSYNSLKDYCSN